MSILCFVCASNGKRLTNIAILSEEVAGFKRDSGLAKEYD